jgi:phosphoglycolate phosphatase-like HAD superfamily hydrolase
VLRLPYREALDHRPQPVLPPRGEDVKQRASILITDVDNTLFDWVDVWYRSFSAMLHSLVELSGIPQEQLEGEIRQVHQAHGTSEYAFLIQELPSLRMTCREGIEPTKRYAPAIDAYRRARDTALVLYPTVLETLREIRGRGSLIIAYTESMAFYTAYRMRRLGLDGLIDFLYSPPDHDLPGGVTAESLREYPSEIYRLEHTGHRHTPPGVKKPNPRILQKIIREVGATVDDVLYLGDSLLKDVPMAARVGVRSALASYGAAQHREEYELLRRVTHWTDEEVEEERRVLAEWVAEPTIELDQSFSQLLTYVEFTSFKDPIAGTDRSWLSIP